MNTTKFWKTAAGMGLVEVMMAVAVTGGLTLTIAKLMDNSQQSAKQVEAKSENTNLKAILQDVLNNPTACNYTFGGVMNPANVAALTAGTPTASVAVPNIKDKTNAIKYDLSSTNISPLTITSMVVTNYNATAFTGDLLVNSTFRKSSTIVMMVKPIRIPINFSFNGAALTACSTMAVGGEWLLGGNAGTVDGTDYIGTSDNTSLNFKVNAQKSGRIGTDGQTFLGYQAGMSASSGISATAFGYGALKYGTSGGENTAIGNYAMFSGFGNNNTAVGDRALLSAAGALNTAIGSLALSSNNGGHLNFAGGAYSLMSNTTGNENSATGHKSLYRNTVGAMNSAYGSHALRDNNNGNENTATGFGALAYNTSGSANTAFGFGAQSYGTSGSSNTSSGWKALYGTSGSFNTAMGRESLRNNSTGNNNSALGYLAGGTSINGSNNLFLGANSGAGATAVSNKLYIDTIGSAVPLIGGDFSSAGRYVTIDGKLGVGTTAPVEKLSVVGKISTNGNIVMSGYQVVQANSTNTVDVQATCPAGKQVTGGGCRKSGSMIASELTTSVPLLSGTYNSWYCAWNVGGASTTYSAYAICAITD
jgi:hypothetical protein